jgi:hypothetical protein
MPKSKLPEAGTEDAEKLISKYINASDTEVGELAKALGYRRDAFVRAIKEQYNAHRKPPTARVPETPPIIIPEIKIREYIPRQGKGDPETQCVCLGDWHYGEETPTFNPEIADKRLDALFHSSMRITELHRHMYPVNDLVLFILGDMTHGENPYQGAKVGTVSKGAVDQVFDLALPKLLSLIASYRENFMTVTAYCVDGNHGRISREAPETSNFDRVLYRSMQQAKWPEGVEIVVAKDFGQMVNIKGHRFFEHHGDTIRMTNGIPYFAQTRKIMSWYVTYGGFEYSVSGHWHKDDFYRVSARTKQITNGALVSDDPYALKTIGTSSIPTQATFGVHERRGVTWYYALTLEDT